MAAGKTYDVMVNAPAAGATALPVFDRELSLSGNAVARDTGMLAYIGVNGAGLPVSAALAVAVARADNYPSVVPCTPSGCVSVVVSDPGKGLIANDTNVFGVQLLAAPTGGTLTLNGNGTFTYAAECRNDVRQLHLLCEWFGDGNDLFLRHFRDRDTGRGADRGSCGDHVRGASFLGDGLYDTERQAPGHPGRLQRRGGLSADSQCRERDGDGIVSSRRSARWLQRDRIRDGRALLHLQGARTHRALSVPRPRP